MQELPDDTPKGIVTGEDAVIYIIRCSAPLRFPDCPVSGFAYEGS